MENYIGQTYIKVRSQLNKLGIDFRVVSIDGEACMITSDFKPERLNIEIENEIVVNIYGG